MGEKWRLYRAVVFFFTYASLEATSHMLSDGDNFHITISGNNSMRPYSVKFQVNLTITNIKEQTVKNVRMKSIFSSNLLILSSTVIIKGITSELKTDAVQFVVSSIDPNEVIIITFKVRVGNGLGSHETGYHIENLLIQLYSKNNEDAFDTLQRVLIPLAYIKPGCDMMFDVDRNGVPGEIRTTSVTASSYYDTSKPSEFGEFGRGWCAKDKTVGQYLQILFKRRVRLTFIGIGGRRGKEDWVKKYRVKFKLGDTWYDYKENGFPKKIKGAKYMKQSFGWLSEKLHCDGLQIIPIEYYGALICLRAAIRGCYISDTESCVNPLGMQNGRIPDELITDSGTDYSPTYARFGKVVTSYPFGWKGRIENRSDWLQIDMLSLYRITRVAIQGAATGLGWVKTVQLEYSIDTKEWTKVNDVLQGPSAEYEARDGKIIDLKHTIVGRSFRLTPVDFQDFNVMRVELFGCIATWLNPQSIEGEVYNDGTRSVLVDQEAGIIFMCQTSSVRSSCFYSDEEDSFKVWKRLPFHIVKMVAVDTSSDSWYARTRRGSYTLKESSSAETWCDISNDEWNRRTSAKELVESISIPSMMSNDPTKVGDTYCWTTRKDNNISVTGIGVHLRSLNADWKLKARWTCCGF